MTVELLQQIDADGEIIPAGRVLKIYDPATAQEMIRRGIARPFSGISSTHDTSHKQIDSNNTFILTASPLARKSSVRKGKKVYHQVVVK